VSEETSDESFEAETVACKGRTNVPQVDGGANGANPFDELSKDPYTSKEIRQDVV
jgi:hypothetical protein